MNLLNELKRRNVFRIAGIYAVVSWVLMQVASTLEASLNLPDWFDSVITAGLLIGFPVALLLAWAFEMTPEGVRPTESISDKNNSTSSNKLDAVIIVGIISILGLGVWQQLSKPDITQAKAIPSTESSKPNKKSTEIEIIDASIAVLPFTDLSKNGDQEYFSDGIAEEILNVLVRVKSLKVTSRTSAFQFKGSNIGIPEIANQLKVRHILEGSVRKSGDTIRITAQLIDAQNDKHLWSDTYDRPLSAENIFAIQDDISNAIVIALKSELGLITSKSIEIKHSTKNLTAYELYLQALPLFHARLQLDKADSLLIQAIELDPEFAQAWALRAALQYLMVGFNYIDRGRDEASELGVKFANQAIALDPNSALAYATKAFVRLEANNELRGKFDFADIINDLEKALAINPNDATTLNWLARTYQSLGFLDKAHKTLKRCIDHEPLYFSCVGGYIYISQDIGKYQTAIDAYQTGLMNGSITTPIAPFEALNHFDNKLTMLSALGSAELFSGWHRTGELYLAFKNPDEDHTDLIKAALAYLSDQKRAINFYWADALVTLGYEESGIEFVFRFGQTSKFYNSPKFKLHMKNSGVAQYWQEHGYPPQCRPLPKSEVKNDFECVKYQEIK